MTKAADKTPAQAATAAAAVTHEVTDKATGRKLTLKKPGVLAQYDFIEMLGPSRAANGAYVQMAMPVLYLVAIDGDPVDQPGKFSELRALLQRLDDSGIATIALGIEEKFGAQLTPEQAKAALKK